MADWRERERERLQKHIAEDTYEKDGALFWSSVDRPVPVHTFRDAGLDAPAAQAEVCSAHAAVAIAQYVERRERHGYGEEERAEIRAEFGDEPVVDILTGRRIQ